jgi:ArsR family transcriptional regulator
MGVRYRDTDLADAASLFHALSDLTRLEIVHMLSDGERCVCELTAALDVAQSRLSFHLKTLRDAGLVNDRREGRWVYYSLNPDAFDELAELVSALEPAPTPRSSSKACCD